MTWNPPESVNIGRSQFMKRCRPPRRGDDFRPGPQHQMVGVAQQDVGAGLANVFRQHRLDRRGRPHGHERRCRDGAPFSPNAAKPGPTVTAKDLK